VGCLKLISRLGCLVLFVAAVVVAWFYRGELLDAWHHWRRGGASAEWVAPAPGGAQRSRHSLEELASRGGPAYVDLDAAEIAALIEEQLARAPRRAFDSVQVALGEDEVRVRGSVDLSSVPRNVLGPFRGAMHGRERVTVGGTLLADSVGHLQWQVGSLQVGSFPFPRSTIGRVLRAFNVTGAENARVPLPLERFIGDVRVSPGTVRLYRASRR
jgi:hypothetical protein